MIADPGLEAAVTAFEKALTPIVQTLAGTVAGVDPDALADDVTREALSIVAAVIDCDGIRTDAELWSLLVVFGPRIGGDLLRATPDDLRRSDLVVGRASWLDTPSTLLDLLARYDARHATTHARTYHDRAVAVAFAVAAIDPYTTEDELRAIERFRSSMARAGAVGDPTTPAPGVPAAAAVGAAAGDADVAALPPPRPIEELMAELDALVGLEGVKAEVKLVADLIRVQNLRARARPPGGRPEPPPRLRRQPGHRQDHRGPAAGPDLPDPRRGRAGPPGRDRPHRPGRRLRRPDRHQGGRGLRPSRRGRRC